MTNELREKAMAAVAAAASRADQDPTRPVFHYRPPAQWMNDVCAAFFYKGFYHAFHQFNPWSDEIGVGIGWGHARSRDLVRWQFLPPALLPSAETDERLTASGSAFIRQDGTPMLFFTHTPIEFPEKKREAWAALPIDDQLVDWRRIDIGLKPGKGGVPATIGAGWADMFVFQQGDRVFATFKESDGLICEAQNEQLTSWNAVGNLGGRHTQKSANTGGVSGECPNLFSLQDCQVLLRSTYPISYLIGEFDPEVVTFRAKNGPYVLDYGYGGDVMPHYLSRGIYGTTVFTDPAGRTILLGWVSGFKAGRGWNGCMSLPRILRIDDGRLIQTPLPELEDLRGKHTYFENLKIHNESKRLEGIRGDTLEIIAEITGGDGAAFGIKVRCSEDGKQCLLIRYAAGILNAAGTEVPLELGEESKTLKLHIYLDKSVMELFLQEGNASVTRVNYPSEENLDVFVFAEGNIPIRISVDAWEMKSIWDPSAKIID